MADKITSAAVMFADIAGSTQLYEKLGDVVAESKLSKSVQMMISIVLAHRGVLIKTIGDEAMCRFECPFDALSAACAIQLEVKKLTLMDDSQPRIRVGVHFGKIIFKDSDVFGDTVNVAARMAGLARADQIITTGDTMEAIGVEKELSSRRLDALYVKGKSTPVVVHEVLWDAEDDELTALFSPLEAIKLKPAWQLDLDYQGYHAIVTSENSSVLMGRGLKCDLVINSQTASRNHAKIEARRGKAVLIDQSTNGTFVKLDSGDELFLHKEELPLAQSGMISLGAPNEENPAHIIEFKYSRND